MTFDFQPRIELSLAQTKMDAITLKEYMTFIDGIVNEAGKVMKKGFYGEKKVETKKYQWDLVTDYDKKVESIIVSGILSKYPSHKIIAEEDEAGKEESKVTKSLTDDPSWLIDPIDGTFNYVRGIPETCISVALAIKKQVVVAVVYNPITDHKYTAIKGQGAYLNGREIHVSQATGLQGSVVSFEFMFIMFPKQGEKYKQRYVAVTEKIHALRSLGSAAVTLCNVAAGGIDAYFMEYLKSWDMAAGVLIIQEAGGYVCSMRGGDFDLFSQSIIATANKAIADELLEIFKKHP